MAKVEVTTNILKAALFAPLSELGLGSVICTVADPKLQILLRESFAEICM